MYFLCPLLQVLPMSQRLGLVPALPYGFVPAGFGLVADLSFLLASNLGGCARFFADHGRADMRLEGA